ncbi:MAG: SDR family NAD(P)-dependent oxidoreductase [Paraburkholderia fungorum]|jgi:NAD(P)-dependent dehydrogenase (short-subunit alcohol dehydrogenase family)|nr:SDR family NAD(P)-dependent oxidoreductase [Paraburkholderia fungorum]
MSKIWLVTGAARGLGRSIVEAALAAGDRVVATARNPERLADLEKAHGGNLRTFALDVTDADAARAAIDFTVRTFSGLDVLVNNAGFGQASPFEQISLEDFRAQIDVNFYGVVNLTHAALPVLRKQRSGYIINISSSAGRAAIPAMTAYTAAKWAVGGFTEALSMEVEALGIKVTAVEPGGLRTEWSSIASSDMPELLPEYQESVGNILDALKNNAGHEIGDPARAAKVVIDLAGRDEVPKHLLLGSDAVRWVSLTEGARQKSDTEWKAVSISTDLSANVDLSHFDRFKG